MRRVLVLCVIALLPATVFATAAHAATPDACALLTAADLQSQFGPAFDLVGEETGTTPSCDYYAQGVGIDARLSVTTASNVKSAKEQLKFRSAPKDLADGSTRRSKKVKRLGDDARFFPFTSTGSDSYLAPVLLVRAGKIILQLTVTSIDDNGNAIEDKPATLALARVVIGRL